MVIKKITDNLKSKPAKKNLDGYGGQWLKGSQCALIVTAKTAKSLTLEYSGVSLGKHFGVMHERKPS